VSDRTLALKFNKSEQYPMRDAVLAFGTRCFVKRPAEVIERIGTAMSESLAANSERFPRNF
jgi:serine/threonine-protein kinase HipA